MTMVYSMVIKTWSTGKTVTSTFVYAGLWLYSPLSIIIDILGIKEGPQLLVIFNNQKTMMLARWQPSLKALPLLVWKLRPKLKFFNSRSNTKVKVTRNTHVKNQSPIFYGFKDMDKVKVFVHTANADPDYGARALTLAPWTFVRAR